jgi:hypothetical protein
MLRDHSVSGNITAWPPSLSLPSGLCKGVVDLAWQRVFAWQVGRKFFNSGADM